MFCVVYSAPAIGAGDPRPRGRDQLRGDGPRRPGVRVGRAGLRRRRDHDHGRRCLEIYEKDGKGFYVFETDLDQPGRRPRSCAGPGPTSSGGSEMAEASDRGRATDPGAAGHPGQVPAAPLRGRLGRLQPDPHRPRVREGGRAAAATSSTASTRWRRSRAANAALAGGDPRALKRLSVQFRGMGLPEQEIVVTGTVKRGRRRPRRRSTPIAAQGDNQIIRNAEAELEL